VGVNASDGAGDESAGDGEWARLLRARLRAGAAEGASPPSEDVNVGSRDGWCSCSSSCCSAGS
jgi:hypothetical protein